MPIAAFIPLIAAGIGAGGSIVSSKIQSNAQKKAIAAQQAQANNPNDPTNLMLETQRKIAEASFAGGQQDIASARKGLNFSTDWWNKVSEGNPDFLMKFVDSSGATRQMDDNEQIASELGVRGGRRAAAISNATFSRDAFLNNIIKQLQFAAPDKIAGIAQIFGNLGSQQLSTASGASSQVTNALLTEQQIAAQREEAEANRKAGLVSGIMNIGGSLGAILLNKKLNGGDDEDSSSGGSIFSDPTKRYPASPDFIGSKADAL